MAIVLFCEICYAQIRDHSTITLLTWTSACFFCLNEKRLVTLQQFRYFMHENHGLSKKSVDSHVHFLETRKFILTHEVNKEIWLCPLGLERRNKHMLSICPQRH